MAVFNLIEEVEESPNENIGIQIERKDEIKQKLQLIALQKKIDKEAFTDKPNYDFKFELDHLLEDLSVWGL